MMNKNQTLSKKEKMKRKQEVTEQLNVYHEEIHFQNKELQRAQVALEKSKDSYKELFLKAPAAYVIYTNDNVLKKVNEVFCELIQLSEKEALETSISDYINEKDQDNFYFHKKKILNNNTSGSIDLTINGRKVIAISNLIQVKDELQIKMILIPVPGK